MPHKRVYGDFLVEKCSFYHFFLYFCLVHDLTFCLYPYLLK